MTKEMDLQTLLKEYLQYQQQNVLMGYPVELYRPTNYILDLPGKRIRPLLCLIGYGLYQDSLHKAMPLAFASEVFHNFTLIHDDVIDNAPLRRGKPTVHEHFGLNTAILSGDAMLVRAYTMLINLEMDDSVKLDLIRHFCVMAEDVCRGQQLDVNFETIEKVSEAGYIEMIGLKTSVLLGFCLQAGALLGGASKQQAHDLYNYGLHTGLAFQIMDDYLDAFGDSEQVGKQIGGDILEDKKTILWINLMHKIDANDADQLRQFNNLNPDLKIAKTLELYRKYGVDVYTLAQMNHYFNLAHKELDGIETMNSKSLLLDLMSMLKSRQA